MGLPTPEADGVHYLWTCGCCGKQFDTLPLDYGFDAPHHWMALTEEEQQRRGRIDSDICIIQTEERRDIFVRGCVEIPIIGQEELFIWGVWTSVSEASFQRIRELWSGPVSEDEPPRFGWLCNSIGHYPETLSLATSLHLRNDGLRPAIQLHRCDHILYFQQQNGITLQEVEEIAAQSRLH